MVYIFISKLLCIQNSEKVLCTNKIHSKLQHTSSYEMYKVWKKEKKCIEKINTGKG